MSQKNVPLIELRGFAARDAKKFLPELQAALKAKLDSRDQKHLVFEIVPSKVIDINGNSRPYLRLYSREFALFHKIVECLREMKWEGEIDVVMLQNYQDLRTS